MSSSTEAAPSHVLRGSAASGATALPTPELRGGSWTRFGAGSVRGDAVTERALAGLAETTRHAARSQGYTVGWAEGRRAAAAAATAAALVAKAALAAEDSRREAEHRAQLDALTRAAAGFAEATRTIAARLEDHALLLARELAELVVGHELSTRADPAADVVRRVLVVLPDGVPATVRLHPDVAAATAGARLGDRVLVVADDTLDRHDAVVETATQVVDLCIGATLERVREALS